jgi:hypothetical protein
MDRTPIDGRFQTECSFTENLTADGKTSQTPEGEVMSDER